MSAEVLLPSGHVPGQGAVVNPFVIIDDAAGFVRFVASVFGAEEDVQARTQMPGGLLIHAQLRLGDVDLMVSDRLEGWPARPALLQVWVNDVAKCLQSAEGQGATVVTEATAFYGERTLGRFLDRWDNLWWLWASTPGQPDPVPAWDGGSDAIFSTLDTTMRSLGASQATS